MLQVDFIEPHHRAAVDQMDRQVKVPQLHQIVN